MNKLFIWGMLTHLLNTTGLMFLMTSFLKLKSRDAEEKKNKNNQKTPKRVVCFVADISWYIYHYPSASSGLFFWNNAAREGSANCTCNFLSVLNSRQFQILLTLLIWFSPTENPSVPLFHWQRKCCLICSLFPACQISNLGSPHPSVCYFLLRNKPSISATENQNEKS